MATGSLRARPRVRRWIKLSRHFDLFFELVEQSWLSLARLLTSGSRAARAGRSRIVARFLPLLEVLEARQMPTTVQFPAAALTAGLGSTQANFTVNLDAASNNSVSVDYYIGSSGDDSASGPHGTVYFNPGQTTQSFTIDVSSYSLGSTFELCLTNPYDASLGNLASATVTIVPVIAFNNSNVQVNYNATAYIDVDLSASPTQPVTVDYQTADGTAIAGKDYASTGGTLSIPAGQTHGTIAVPLLSQPEPGSPTFTLDLTNPSDAVLNGLTCATVTILEPPVAINFHSAAQQVAYNSGTTVEVDLSNPSSQAVTVHYATQNGTGSSGAVAGTDYTSASGTLTFAAGVTSATFTITTLNPTETANKSFNLVLSSPSNAPIGWIAADTITLLLLPTITFAAPYNGPYNAATHPTTATVSGLGGISLGSATISYSSGNAPKNAGSYTAFGSYAGGTISSGGHTYIYSSSVAVQTIAIQPAALTITAQTNTKTYDGTTSAAAKPTVSGLQGSDTVTSSTLSEAYASKNAGTIVTLIVSAGYVINDGNNGHNYAVTTVSTSGVINKAPLTITAATNSKTYDATTSASATPTVSGLIGNDTATGLHEAYSDANVGTGKTLVVTGYTINDGVSGANYTISTPNGTGSIGAAPLTISATAKNKVWDSTTSVPAAPTVSGLKGSDTVTDLSEFYASAGIGSGITINVNPDYVINDGNGGKNYAVTVNESSGTITQATPTIVVTSLNVPYTGTAYTTSAEAFVSSPVGNVDVGPVTISYSSGGNPVGAPVAAGSYTVTATLAGTASYAAATGTGTITISTNTIAPTIVISSITATYDGQPHAIMGEVFGIGGVYLGQAVIAYPYGNPPVDVGAYTVTASFTASGVYAGASQTATITITPATPIISVTPVNAIYDGNSHGTTGTVYGVDGSFLGAATLSYGSGNPSSGPMAPGIYAVTASYAGGGDYASTSVIVSGAITIIQAQPTITIQPVSAPYSSQPQTITGTVTGVGNVNLGSAAITYLGGSAPTAPGSYTVTGTYSGNVDYTSASGTGVLQITKAVPTIVVSDAGGTYGAASFAASANAYGLGNALLTALTPSYYDARGNLLSGVPTEVGNYTVVASFAGNADYAAAQASITFTISPAQPAVTISASITATLYGPSGIITTLDGGPPVLPMAYYNAQGQSLSAAPTQPGSYIAVASFAGSPDGDYGPAVSQPFAYSIQSGGSSLPQPTVVVTDSGGTYNGSTYPATAQVAATSGSTPQSSLDGKSPTLAYFTRAGAALAGSPKTAGSYVVVASYPGTANYAPASAAISVTISRATPTITFDPSSGLPNALVAGIVSGTDNTPNLSLEGVTPTVTYLDSTGHMLIGPPAAPGTYTAQASFPGSTDYAPTTAQCTFSIGSGLHTPTLNVVDAGGVYNGSPFLASVTVAGSSGVNPNAPDTLEQVKATLSYYLESDATSYSLPGAPTQAGTYAVQASFAGSPDYTSAVSSTILFIISPANPTLSVSDPGGTYTGQAFPATVTIMGISGGSLEGVSPTLTYYDSNGKTLGGAPSAVGNYSVIASFGGSSDYALVSTAPLSFSISPAASRAQAPRLQVVIDDGPYDGAPFTASALLTGLNVGDTPQSTLAGVSPIFTYKDSTGNVLQDSSGNPLPPSLPGTYTVTASWTPPSGNTIYLAVSANATFTIGPATPLLSVSDPGGTATSGNATSFPATVELFDVAGNEVSNLGGFTPTWTYRDSSGNPVVDGSNNPLAPSTPGIYTVTAYFRGDLPYYTPVATQPVVFTIDPSANSLVPTTIVLSAPGGIYNASPYTATATVTANDGTSPTGITLTYLYASSDNYGDTAGQVVTDSNHNPIVPTDVGTYTVVANYAGNSQYAQSNASATLTIAQATPTVTVTSVYAAYGQPCPDPTVTVVGLGNQPLTSPGITVSYSTSDGNKPSTTTPAGRYAITASFPGNRDYTQATGSGTATVGVTTTTTTPPGSGSGSGGSGGGGGGSGGSGGGSGSSTPTPVSYLPAVPGWQGPESFATVDSQWWGIPALPSGSTLPTVTFPGGEGFGPPPWSPYLLNPDWINNGVTPGNAALAQAWSGGGGPAVGNLPQQETILALIGTMAQTPQGGQYVLPDQGGMTAPSGGLADLANNPTAVQGLATQSAGVPLIIADQSLWGYSPLVDPAVAASSGGLPGFGLMSLDNKENFGGYTLPGSSGSASYSTTATGSNSDALGNVTLSVTEAWAMTWNDSTTGPDFNVTGSSTNSEQGTSSVTQTLTQYNSSGNEIWQQTLTYTTVYNIYSFAAFANGYETQNSKHGSGTTTSSDSWVVNFPTEGSGNVNQNSVVQGNNTYSQDVSYQTYELYSFDPTTDLNPLTYKNDRSQGTVTASHSLLLNGQAQ